MFGFRRLPDSARYSGLPGLPPHQCAVCVVLINPVTS